MEKKVRDLATIEAEIAATKEALANVRGTETEVYARIVGYYRSVRNWNKGKRDEYNHRKQFVVDKNISAKAETVKTIAEAKPVTTTVVSTAQGTPASYEFFARKTCPNCPPVKEYLSGCILPGELIDVDTKAGLAHAAELGVFAAPTVIIYDSAKNEIARAHNAQDLAEVFDKSASKTFVEQLA